MWEITGNGWRTSSQTKTKQGNHLRHWYRLTLLGSSCTKPSTTGMRAEAATALTSSSRSCRPTVMAGSTRGSKAEIRSWKRYREKTRQIMVSIYVYTMWGYYIKNHDLYSDIFPNAAQMLTDQINLFFPPPLYSQTYDAQIKCIIESCCAYFRSHHIHTHITGGTCRTARAYLIPRRPPWRASHWSSFSSFSRTSTVMETPVSFMWRRATPSVWAHVSLTGATTW